MADQDFPHVDVAGWLLGELDDDEARDTQAHVDTCAACRAEVDDLSAVVDFALSSGPSAPPPPDLEDRIVDAVGRAAREDDDARHTRLATPGPATPGPAASRPSSTRPRTSRAPRRGGLAPGWLRRNAAGVVALAALAIVVGVVALDGPAGVLEVDADLVAAAGAPADITAAVEVRRLETGRAIHVTSTTLPILPEGGLYELWFVGPGDTPDAPNRVSAGTFHPAEDGTTDVVLHAAVVPAEYPTLVITAEPKDGNPLPNGPEVVRVDP